MSDSPYTIGAALERRLLAAAGALRTADPLLAGGLERPAITRVLGALEGLRGVILCEGPSRSGAQVEHTLQQAMGLLAPEVERALGFTEISTAPMNERVAAILSALAEELPMMRAMAIEEAVAACRFDPGCASVIEALYCLPGLAALGYHRFAHFFYQQGVPLLPRGISEFVHSATGIDIHPGAVIGRGCFIDHGTGVVIGESARVGDGVRIYQGVTLGVSRFESTADGSLVKGQPRHPIVGNNVVLYAGATLLGRISVGDRSVIAAGSRVTQDLPQESRVGPPHLSSAIKLSAARTEAGHE